MINTEIISTIAVRTFSGKLAELKRMADNHLIPQHVWLTAFQYAAYPERRNLLIGMLRPCMKTELKRLGVLHGN